jgi:hypothetical protein
MRLFLPALTIKQFFAELCNIFIIAPVLAQLDCECPIGLEMAVLEFTIAGMILPQHDKVYSSAKCTVQGREVKKYPCEGLWHQVANRL